LSLHTSYASLIEQAVSARRL